MTATTDFMGLLATAPLAVGTQRPWLLFDRAQVETIRTRAQARTDVLARVRARCEELLATPAEDAASCLASWPARDMVSMAEGYLLFDYAPYAAWTKTRAQAMLGWESWKFTEHQGNPYCDHVMANVGAYLAYMHDLLGEAADEEFSTMISDGVRRHLLLPFLEGTRTRLEWWSREGTVSNWKIMTCGETGFAACAFADRWPEAREALGLALRGVLETLDQVPPEGDWGEGVGYWFTTLFMGLRFAAALRRLTQGTVNLFTHPTLRTTGDFASMLTTPGGRVFNFNDNRETLGDYDAGAVLLLASEGDRPDWRYTARRFPQESVLWFALDDPQLPADPAATTTAVFPTTGIATTREAWTETAAFVALKSGPSTVGHSHLDANAFVVEASAKPLLIDEGFWWYGDGFFDLQGGRWEYDNNATIGHSTLLVDSQGQSWGADYAGKIVGVDEVNGWRRLVGEAGACYPGLLTQFTRTLLIRFPDLIVIRDVVACAGPRHLEWLLHYAGVIRSEGTRSIVEHEGMTLEITPLLPNPVTAWRVSDVTRTSTFRSYDLDETMHHTIRYRSFAPFRPAERLEFLFALRIGERKGDWAFHAGEEGLWELASPDGKWSVRPEGDTLTVMHHEADISCPRPAAFP